jgi:hypothetical protein
MKLKISVALLTILPFAVNANVWDDIKKLPATQYDVGRIFTELGALELNKRLEGQKLEGTKYKVSKVSSITDGKLGFKFSFEARGKYINPADCSKFATHFKNGLVQKKGVVSEFWPSLPEALSSQLNEQFAVEAELINKDNEAVMSTCGS